METNEQEVAAIEALDTAQWMDWDLKVNKARQDRKKIEIQVVELALGWTQVLNIKLNVFLISFVIALTMFPFLGRIKFKK